MILQLIIFLSRDVLAFIYGNHEIIPELTVP